MLLFRRPSPVPLLPMVAGVLQGVYKGWQGKLGREDSRGGQDLAPSQRRYHRSVPFIL